MTKKTTTRRSLKSIRGGKREGAGRPYGSGKYGEATRAIRVPNSLVDELQQYLDHFSQKKISTSLSIFIPKIGSTKRIPLYEHKVAAGFPSPAEDHIDLNLDLNEYVMKNPATTFYVRVAGHSMENAGIFPNDILVVDRSLEACDGNIVIAIINDEFTVKRLKITKNKQISLVPENDHFPIVTIKEGMDFTVWGVVTNVIHTCL